MDAGESSSSSRASPDFHDLGANVAHVEAWMRVEHLTLDALSPSEFRREVAAALLCIAACTREQSDALAAALGIAVARQRLGRAGECVIRRNRALVLSL